MPLGPRRSTALAAALVAGCYASHGEPPVDAAPPDAGDGGVAAPVDARTVAVRDPSYPRCLVSDPSACPAVDLGGEPPAWGYRDPRGCLDGCQCRHVCEGDADCPRPATGTSQPACIGETCALPCDEPSVACPRGMICVTNGSRGARFCMWTRELAPGCG
jgi:hypothetical protein